MKSAESVSAFWVAYLEEYSMLKRLTFYVLIMFLYMWVDLLINECDKDAQEESIDA